jgi:hypothetical protein
MTSNECRRRTNEALTLKLRDDWEREPFERTQEFGVLNSLLGGRPAGTSTRQQRFCIGKGGWRAPRRANMSEGSKGRSTPVLARVSHEFTRRAQVISASQSATLLEAVEGCGSQVCSDFGTRGNGAA